MIRPDLFRADLRHIAHGDFEDAEGLPWILHPQRGWIRLPADDRHVRASRILRTLLRFRRSHREQAYRIARRLEGDGWWASHALDLGYA